jgi:hypothetical protein
MMAGRLRDRVALEIRTGETWSPDPSTMGGLVWMEATRVSETAARFVLRYRPDIRPDTHRLVYWNARWNVTDVVHDQRRDMTTIDSDFSEKLEVTHLASPTKEWIDGLPVVHP